MKIPEFSPAGSAYDRMAAQSWEASDRLEQFQATWNPWDTQSWQVEYNLKREAQMRAWAVGQKLTIEHHLAKTILSST